MSQDRKQKLPSGFLFAEVPFFTFTTAARQVWPGVFMNIFFSLQNIKSPALGLITLPFISQGSFYSPFNSEKNEEVASFRTEKCTGERDVEWTLGTGSES
jgi:hypothetical protein